MLATRVALKNRCARSAFLFGAELIDLEDKIAELQRLHTVLNKKFERFIAKSLAKSAVYR